MKMRLYETLCPVCDVITTIGTSSCQLSEKIYLLCRVKTASCFPAELAQTKNKPELFCFCFINKKWEQEMSVGKITEVWKGEPHKRKKQGKGLVATL